MAEAWVGIAAVGYYVPDGVQTSSEMAELAGFPEYVFTDKIGIRQKPVAGPEEHPSDMGLKAAQAALARAEISPEMVDVIAYCGGAFYDYGLWSPAARIQHQLGALNACAFEVRNGCNGGNLGLHLVSRQLLADPELECGLVVCSDAFSRLVNYQDDRQLSLFHCSDGATAAVLLRNQPSNRLRAYTAVSDGTFVDAIRVPLGGTRMAWTPDSVAQGLDRWLIEDPEELAIVYSDLYLKNYVRVIRDAVRKSGRRVEEIDFLFTNQVKRSTLEAILQRLGLPAESSYPTIERFGHMAASDTLLALALSTEEGKIGRDDLVVLASSGTGFNWAAMVLEYRA